MLAGRQRAERQRSRKGGDSEERSGEKKRGLVIKKMSEPAANPAATSFPAPDISLPLGFGVLRTYSGALVLLEIVSIIVCKCFYDVTFISCCTVLRCTFTHWRSQPAQFDFQVVRTLLICLTVNTQTESRCRN